MPAGDQAFFLIGIILCLGACLIWAFCEIEIWRQRQRWRQEVIRDAMGTVVMVMDDDEDGTGR